MASYVQHTAPEIWGGIECTINRVGSVYRDQLDYSGFYRRPNDLEQLCSLGFKKFRFPVLWERHYRYDDHATWKKTSNYLSVIFQHGIEPIAGLLHHGSGPPFTNLLDPEFPARFADYAYTVASRFPFLRYYTPVNEPLTTARFSGLYGHWYPHAKNENAFATILLHQLKATILAMEAIRTINPDAVLVQTEDLGKTHATMLLQYQADFENERRWWTHDFLAGKITPDTGTWNWLSRQGIKYSMLDFFTSNNCSPGILGYNYYATSERYLDEDIFRYPSKLHGGNGQHIYTDTEAIRHGRSIGAGALLTESWERYQLPIALTECYMNCTREDQLRWFFQHWKTISKLQQQGVSIKGITAWALLGSMDWDTLLCSFNGNRETGAFITNDNRIEKNALGRLIASLASTGECSEPIAFGKGWWEPEGINTSMLNKNEQELSPNPVLLLGSETELGAQLLDRCKARRIECVGIPTAELIPGNLDPIRTLLDRHQPWAVIYATASGSMNEAEVPENICRELQVNIPGRIASICHQRNICFTCFSSHLVFDGSKGSPYLETDTVNPVTTLGKNKADGEFRILRNHPRALIIRLGPLFSVVDSDDANEKASESFKEKRLKRGPMPRLVTPVYIPSVANTTLDMLIDQAGGVYHLSHGQPVPWLDFQNMLTGKADDASALTLQVTRALEAEHDGPMPVNNGLGTIHGYTLPPFEKIMAEYLHHCREMVVPGNV